MYSIEKSRGLNFIKQFDYPLFIAVLVLSAIGIVVLSSATYTMSNGSSLMKTQIISLILGIVLSLAIATTDYKDYKTLGFVFYVISVGLLVLVLFKGTGETSWGSKSWLRFKGIGGIQPSELAKITCIIIISMFMERMKEGNQPLKNGVKMVIYFVIPIALVLLQPDFGTTMVFIFMFFVMLFIYGIPYKYIGGAILVSIPAFLYLWFFRLKGYQKDRIMAVFFPELDPGGSGFNVIQAKTAIKFGQIYGDGIYKGFMTQNALVPVKTSDFIFTVIGEELGFIGAAVVIGLILFILLRCIYIAKNSRDLYGSFMVTGLSGMIAFHFIENIGMCIGLLPVTGIPLPFVSSGGSAMVTNYIAIGIILSVSIRRKRVIFNNSQ